MCGHRWWRRCASAGVQIMSWRARASRVHALKLSEGLPSSREPYGMANSTGQLALCIMLSKCAWAKIIN